MPSIEEDVVAMLKAEPSVTAIVGSGNAAEIYFDAAPQGAAATRIVAFVLSLDPDHAHDGRHGGDRYLFQVSCYSASRATARALADAAAAALDHHTRPNGEGVFLLDDENSDAELAGDAGDAPIYKIDQTYIHRRQ